ncbi:MAG: PAS domain S-box protein [Alphaproteobacteria bacterium]|nr:PAS domain S-box protein [Alphaproteobacteria bacterium]
MMRYKRSLRWWQVAAMAGLPLTLLFVAGDPVAQAAPVFLAGSKIDLPAFVFEEDNGLAMEFSGVANNADRLPVEIRLVPWSRTETEAPLRYVSGTYSSDKAVDRWLADTKTMNDLVWCKTLWGAAGLLTILGLGGYMSLRRQAKRHALSLVAGTASHRITDAALQQATLDITRLKQDEANLRAQNTEVLACISRIQNLFIGEGAPEIVFDALIADILQLTNSQFGFIAELVTDTDGSRYQQMLAFSDTAPTGEASTFYGKYLLSDRRFERFDGLNTAAIVSGEVIIVNDPDSDSRCHGHLLTEPQALDAFLGLPLSRGKTIIGSIGLANRPGGYDAALVTYLRPVIESAARILDAYHNERQRRAAAEALSDSEFRHSLVVKAAKVAVWDWNLATNVTVWSGEMTELFGYPTGRMENSHQWWLDRIHPDDLARVQESLEAYLGTFCGTWTEEYRFLRPDGRWAHTIHWGMAVHGGAAGRPSRMVGAIMDIGERKEMERKLTENEMVFRQMFELNTSVKLVIDPNDWSIVDANNAAARFYGYPRDRLTSLKVSDINLVPPAEPVCLEKSDDEEEPSIFECQHRLASGEIRDVEVYSGPIERDGNILLFATIIDITNRKRYERELEKTSAELKRSNAELEQFAYVASHDLRQPLRMVTSYLKLLEQKLSGTLDDDGKVYMQFAVNGARRMDTLILALLEYSQVSKTDFSPLAVSLDDVITEALANLDAAIKEASASITLQTGLPCIVAHPFELVQLFQNLIGNAVKYRAKDRRPQIVIGCHDNETEVVLWVRDNGIGIEPKNFDRAFGIFQRLVGYGEYEGTGIGLAICRKVVEHHNGRIWIEPVPEGGSLFLVAFPKRCLASQPARNRDS